MANKNFFVHSGLTVGSTTTFTVDATSGNIIIGGVTTVTNTTSATNTASGALQIAGGAGIGGDLYARNIFSNNARVLTTLTGVTSIIAGTGTAVSTSTGAVTVWVTPSAGFESVTVDSVSQQFDGLQSVFDLRVDQQYINSIVDSKDAEVILDGQQLFPYVDEVRWPWHTPYDSFKGFRIVNGITTSTSVQLIIYNAPYIGDSASVTIRTQSTARKKRKYPFSAATIALGD